MPTDDLILEIAEAPTKEVSSGDAIIRELLEDPSDQLIGGFPSGAMIGPRPPGLPLPPESFIDPLELRLRRLKREDPLAVKAGELAGEAIELAGETIVDPAMDGLSIGQSQVNLSVLVPLALSGENVYVEIAAEMRNIKERGAPAAVQKIGAAGPPGEVREAILEIAEDSPLDFVSGAVGLVGQVIPSLAEVTLPSAATGFFFGGPIGLAAGIGVSSTSMETMLGIMERLESEFGVDVTDPLALKKAFANPEMMRQVKIKSALKGVPIGVIDAVSAGVAGRVFGIVGKTKAGTIGRVSGEIAVQSGMASSGELLGQLAAGDELSFGEAFLEGIVEGVAGPVEIAINLKTRGMAVGAIKQRLKDSGMSDVAIKELTPQINAAAKALVEGTEAARAEETAQEAPVEGEPVEDAISTEQESVVAEGIEAVDRAGVLSEKERAGIVEKIGKKVEGIKAQLKDKPKEAEAARVDEEDIEALEQLAKSVKSPRKIEDTEKERLGAEVGAVRQRIDSLIFDLDEATVSERAALKAAMRVQTRANTIAQRRDRRRLMGEFERQANEMMGKVIAAATGRLAKQKEGAKTEQNAIREDLRAQFIRLIQQSLPKGIQAKALARVLKVKTAKSLVAAIEQSLSELNVFVRKEAQKDLSDSIKRAQKQKLRPEFQELVDELLKGIDPDKLSKAKFTRLLALGGFMERNPNVLLPSRVTDELDRLGKIPVSELSIEDVNDITDTLESLLHQNDLKSSIIREGIARNMKRLSESVALEIAATANEIEVDVAGRQKPEKEPNIFQLFLDTNLIATPDLMAEILTGSDSSVGHDVLYKSISDAQNEQYRAYHEDQDFMADFIRSLGINPRGPVLSGMSSTASGIYGSIRAYFNKDKDVRTWTVNADLFPIKLESGETMTITSAERMALLASFADRDFREQVILKAVSVRFVGMKKGAGFVLTESDVEVIRASADTQELSIMEAMLRRINTTMKESISVWSIERFGHDITKPDTYFPLLREKEVEAGEVSLGTLLRRTIKSAGILRARRGGSDPFVIKDIFTVYNNLSWSSHGIRHVEPAINDAQRVLRSEPVIRELKNRVGTKPLRYYDTLFDELAKDVIGGGGGNRGFLGDILGPIIRKVTVGRLAVNLRVSAYQFVSVITAATELSEWSLITAIAKGAPVNPAVAREVKANSPYLRQRTEAGVYGLINDFAVKGNGLFGKKAVSDWMMFNIHIIDQGAINTIWEGSKSTIRVGREKVGLPKLSDKALLQETATLAEFVVKRNQPTFNTLDVTRLGLESRRQTTLKLITMFRSQRNKNLSIVFRSLMRARRNPSLRNTAILTRNVTYTLVATSVFIAVIKEIHDWAFRGFKPEDDESKDEVKKFVGSVLDSIISNVPLADVLATGLNNLFGFGRPFLSNNEDPVFGTISSFFTASAKVLKNFGSDDEELWDGLLRVSETFLVFKGLPAYPVTQLRKIIREEEKKAVRRRGPSLFGP